MSKKEKNSQNDGGKYSLKGSWLWGTLLFFILLFIDLATKIAADAYFSAEGAQPIEVIPWGILSLRISYNPGIAFGGLGDADPAVKIGIIIGTAVVMLVLGIAYFKIDKRRSFMRNAMVFVVAGGVGNLIDRLYYRMWANDGGGVRDMVQLDFSPILEKLFNIPPTDFLDFGICNFADFFVVGGAIALVLAFLFFDTDAFFPVGKYKALAQEAKEAEEAEQAKKAD
ncbi:MAG: signal peptidase II [Clostridia bacterium]|nr:signal peptidase II [Clostridia bacterium]